MKALIRTCVLALAAFAACTAPLQAEARPGGHGGGHFSRGHGGWGHGGGWGHSGRFWGGIGLGVGLGALYYGSPWYPGYVVAAPAPYYYDYDDIAPSAPVTRAPPDPVIYPRNGQGAAQTESDRRACDRWAMTQPNAMADASVFQRATLACMDGRGYTMR